MELRDSSATNAKPFSLELKPAAVEVSVQKFPSKKDTQNSAMSYGEFTAYMII